MYIHIHTETEADIEKYTDVTIDIDIDVDCDLDMYRPTYPHCTAYADVLFKVRKSELFKTNHENEATITVDDISHALPIIRNIPYFQ